MSLRSPLLVALVLVAAACSTGDAAADRSATTTTTTSATRVAPSSTEVEAQAVNIERPTSVAIIGDSLTVSAEEEIKFLFELVGLPIVGFDARDGRRMVYESASLSSGRTAIEEVLATETPGLWVIALATNDVGAQRPLDEIRADVESLLTAVGPDVPVVWVDVWIRDRIEGAQRANSVLREVLAGRPDSVVVNWFQYGDDPGVVTGDGIHLTAAGQQKFAEQMMAGIDELFPPGGE